jgi:hypothetical protein
MKHASHYVGLCWMRIQQALLEALQRVDLGVGCSHNITLCWMRIQQALLDALHECASIG